MHNTQLRDIAQVILSARSAGVNLPRAGSASFVKSDADILVSQLPFRVHNFLSRLAQGGSYLKKRGVYVHAT